MCDKNENIVICFCKHPEPGMVKSRLAKDLDNQHAANIYNILLKETLKELNTLNPKILLYCYPDTQHPTLKTYKNSYNLELKNQSDGDLGTKMYSAINDNLKENNIVLIGSDCLEINAAYINEAFDTLNSGNDIVLGPTKDGGYALIGASRIDISIFQDITWGTKEVLEQTKEKLRKLSWSYECLKILRDLDTLDDYHYFSKHEKYHHLFN